MLKIFVSHASDCLTDHLPHGEGLLSFSWLKALAEKGHEVYAFSPHADIKQTVPNLKVFTSAKKAPFPSLKYWFYSHESNKILSKVLSNVDIDIVWRMYPYGANAPCIKTGGKPLVIGPLYSFFNKTNLITKHTFGIKPSKLGQYFGSRSWITSLQRAALILTDDTKLANDLITVYPDKNISQLPAVIEPPVIIEQREMPEFSKGIRLIFIGHFHPSKRLIDFCRIVSLLKEMGYIVSAKVVGEGEEKQLALDYVQRSNLQQEIRFLGRIPNKEVFKALAKSHFLINLRKESYGRNMIEAMSVGVVNVCVNKLAATEFIQQRETGILLDDISVQSYARCIGALAHSPLNWQEMSKRSIEKTKEWLPNKIADQLTKVFSATINAQKN